MGEDTTSMDEAGPVDTPAEAGASCQNCGTPLLGPHCYKCGQPEKGLVRHFSSIIGDFLDSALGFDSRTVRSLWPLFTRPGRLTLEYFEGRRMRYVSPVRLFFFLTIVAFFVGSLVLHADSNPVGADSEVAAQGEAAEAEEGADVEQADDENEMKFDFGNGDWDPVTNPVKVAFLPAFANAWLNAQVGRAERNIPRIREDPDLYLQAALSSVPTTLLVLLPVFALLLKLAYVFKRRLYMEHLIVALHSHAFLCLALLLMFLATGLERWLGPRSPALQIGFDLVEAAIWLWMPLYLLLMQKRVYGQGWTMTVLKFCVIGLCYSILLSFGAAFTTVTSLVWL